MYFKNIAWHHTIHMSNDVDDIKHILKQQRLFLLLPVDQKNIIPNILQK